MVRHVQNFLNVTKYMLAVRVWHALHARHRARPKSVRVISRVGVRIRDRGSVGERDVEVACAGGD